MTYQDVWKERLAPILAGRAASCVDCGAPVVGNTSARYPSAHRAPERCEKCGRRRTADLSKAWLKANPDKRRAMRSRELARHGKNYWRPDARTDSIGRRRCEGCGIMLHRNRSGSNGQVTSWPKWCPECKRKLVAERLSAWRYRRIEQTKANGGIAPDPAVHGKYSTYVQWGCRCEECRHSARLRERTRRRDPNRKKRRAA